MQTRTEELSSGGITVYLHFWTCFFFESNNASYPTIYSNDNLKCFPQAQYLAGKEAGRVLCIIIVVLIYIVGLFGFATNVLNVIVLRRSLIKGTSVAMKRLLIVLAMFEMCACIFSIGLSTVILIILENLSRSEATFVLFKSLSVLFGFSRTAAIYLTILVTIERYLVVAFPDQSKIWISPFKSNVYLFTVTMLALMLDIPWLLDAVVKKNEYIDISPGTKISEFPYIIVSTYFGREIFPKLGFFLLAMNSIVSIPLLVIFNFLLYKSIYNWNKKRKSLSRTQRREINAAKMFSIIVLIIILCQTITLILYCIFKILMVLHRELFLFRVLTTPLNASANFVVYFYYFGRTFRREVKKLLGCTTIDETVSSHE